MSLEYLLEEAKDIGLPINKKRAVIREYLQNILLAGIYRIRLGQKLYFMGGTALRLCYRLPRFSEDLDFNSTNLSYESFQKIAEAAAKETSLEGFRAEIKYEKRGKLYSAHINFPGVMKRYGITDERGMNLMVKLEVNQPQWPQKTQTQVLSYYGLNYTAVVMAESSLITEKLLALLSRNRGRDVYDLLYMLKKKFPFDSKILEENSYTEPPEKLVMERLEKLESKELHRLAKQVQPFLFKEQDTEMIEKAPQYAKKFLENYAAER